MALRNVTNWADLNNALRDLFAFKDRYTTQNIDFHGRRINNASPGVDPSDYVILSQLPTFSETQQPFNNDSIGGGGGGGGGGSVKRYDKITFGIANGAPAQIGSSFTPPYIWSLPLVGAPLICLYAFNVAPVGSSWIITIKRNNAPIFNSPITINDGAGTGIVSRKSDFVNGLSFSQGDLVVPIVTQVGSNIPGQGLEVVIVCTL